MKNTTLQALCSTGVFLCAAYNGVVLYLNPSGWNAVWFVVTALLLASSLTITIRAFKVRQP